MTQDQAIILAFKVVLAAGEVAALLWVAVYTYLARWWENEIGKTVVSMALLLAAALLPSSLSLFFHLNRLTSHIAAWADVATFGLIAVVMFRRVPLWIRLHLRADRTRRYPAAAAFAAEVWRRKFRPVWWGTPRAPGGDGAA